MIKQMILLSVLFAPMLATAQNQTPAPPEPSKKRILGIPTSYTDNPKLEREIDVILDAADSQILQSGTGDDSKEKGKLPSDAWWEKEARSPLLRGKTQQITLEELYLQAIRNSTQIKVFSDVPLIRETAIQEAEGVFDTRGFVESVYDYTNDPITTLLETGEASGRFEQTEFRNQAGVRKRTVTGAEVTLAQEFGFLDNNSEFLVPNPQGVSRLRLALVQPILRGAGIAYNRAIIDVATIDSRAAYQEQIRQAESHLLEICRAYWTLYFARISYVRKMRYFSQAQEIAGELEARDDLDAIQGQLARARSAVAFRSSDLARASMEVANAQDRIRTLINSPDLGALGTTELIPVDKGFSTKFPVNYRMAAQRALKQRPEIQQAIYQIRAAAVREKMSRNEVLPQLNLIMEGYVAGAEGDRNFAGAWGSQFDQGSPGGFIGFSMDFPFENNAAKARLERRKIELRQQFNQLRTTIDTVLLEVKASEREVETAWKDYLVKLEAVKAAKADLDQFTARRELDTVATPAAEAPSTGTRGQSWYLDEWLNTQSRLEYAEQDFARVATIYQVSLTNFERAQGNLLQAENISIVKTKDDKKLPVLKLEKEKGKKTKDGFSK